MSGAQRNRQDNNSRPAASDHPSGRRLGGSPAAARQPTPVFIVTSPRPQVGKTFAARLLVDFLALDRRDPMVFDLNPAGDALCDYLPDLAMTADLTDVKGQMALFDRLIEDDGIAKVVDVGYAAFERFFAVAEEIAFIKEALRRSVEPIVLFAADPHAVAIEAYRDLQGCFRDALLVPIFNEAILKG